MADDETERRIDAARQDAERKKETKEFLDGLKDGDQLVRPVYNPEAFVMREKFRGAASRGEIPRTRCQHPFQYMEQYTDDDPAVQRRGLPVNLFECGVCHTPFWLVDPWGGVVPDG